MDALAQSGDNQHGGAPGAPPRRTKGQMAADLGMSKRSYQEALQIAKSIDPEVQAQIAETEVADSTKQLLELAKLPVETQREVGYKIASGEAESVEAALGKEKAHVSHNSGNMEWYTPPEYIEAATACLGCIDVDPASCEIANQTVQAVRYYSQEDNGLTQPWAGKVWINPPYAQPLILQFAQALLNKFAGGEVESAIWLSNNATETAWFQQLMTAASAICLPKTRVKFLDPAGQPAAQPLQGQVLIYLGPEPDRFAECFEAFGTVLNVRKPARPADMGAYDEEAVSRQLFNSEPALAS
jgi:hypothetical protein